MSILRTTNISITSKLISTSKSDIIKEVYIDNNEVNEVIVEVTIVGKANMGTFQPKTAKFKEFI